MSASQRPYDAVLLVAFGGPVPGCCRKKDPCPGEAFCFVEGILGSDPARKPRVEEVAEHYRQIGGYSPFNLLTFKQAGVLESVLAGRGLTLPVYVGMRHWEPTVLFTLNQMMRDECERILAVILAPHRSPVSWDWYKSTIAGALEKIGKGAPAVDYLEETWHTDPSFVSACASRIQNALTALLAGRRDHATLVFTAHAIPEPIAKGSPYCEQFLETARAVAEKLDRGEFYTAYQSQAKDASVPWTSPDVNDCLRQIGRKGAKDAVLAPVGFLCDHVEVLYDLDVEARRTARSAGVNLLRAETVGIHLDFISMLADRIEARCRTNPRRKAHA